VKSIRYPGEAREEFLHQVRYYSAISRRLGERFDKAIQAAEDLIAEFPDIGSPFEYATRRVFPKKFKFSLVYIQFENEILILAVAPFLKKPGYWKTRRSDG
jgi:plasmid stabilization system protein ParE